MALCPFGQHRLILSDALACKRCGKDLSVYAHLRDLSISIYNLGRDHWERGELDEAKTCLTITMRLRPNLPEVYWLMAAIYASQGYPDEAKTQLVQARILGADVDPDWIHHTDGDCQINPTSQLKHSQEPNSDSQDSQCSNPTSLDEPTLNT